MYTGRCHIMEAIEMVKTRANADTEEWDIVGRAPPGWVEANEQRWRCPQSQVADESSFVLQAQCAKATKPKKAKPPKPSSKPVAPLDPLAAAAPVIEQLIRMKNGKTRRPEVSPRAFLPPDYRTPRQATFSPSRWIGRLWGCQTTRPSSRGPWTSGQCSSG